MTVYTVFGQSGGGALASNAGSFTLGMQFSLSSPATLTGFWWFSVSGSAGLPSSCAVYTTGGVQVSGSLLSSPSWSGAAGSGWVRAALSGGPALSASTGYVVAIFAAPGANWFSDTSAYWTTGPGGSGITSGIITAPNNATAVNGQDPDNSGVSLAFPATSSAGFNFWVDVEVTTGGAAGGPAPANDTESRLIRRYRRMLYRRGLDWEPEVSMTAAPAAFDVPPGWPGTWPAELTAPDPEPEPELVQSPSALAPKWRPVYTRPPKVVRARQVPRDAMMPVWHKTG